MFDFLAGTGFKEDLDDLFGKLEAPAAARDFAAAQNLDRKVFDVNEARHLYEGRIEDVNDIVTALLREERLRVTHESVSGGKRTFVLEPYTLMVYKKGLYLVGRSAGHAGAIRTFALDAFRAVEWLRGDKFDYPVDYRPEQVTEGAFGLIRGGPEVTRVRIPLRRQGGAVRGAGHVAPHATVQANGGGAGDDDEGAGDDGGGGVGVGVRRRGAGGRARGAPKRRSAIRHIAVRPRSIALDRCQGPPTIDGRLIGGGVGASMGSVPPTQKDNFSRASLVSTTIKLDRAGNESPKGDSMKLAPAPSPSSRIVRPRIALLALCGLSLGAACIGGAEPTEDETSALTGAGVTATLSTQSDWGAGYCDLVTITNTGAATTGWQVVVTLNSTYSQSWNATVVVANGQLSAASLSWNGALPTNGSASFGFCGTPPPARPRGPRCSP